MRCFLPRQVIPDVISRVTGAADLKVEYGGKPISNGEHLSPSETQVTVPYEDVFIYVFIDACCTSALQRLNFACDLELTSQVTPLPALRKALIPSKSATGGANNQDQG